MSAFERTSWDSRNDRRATTLVAIVVCAPVITALIVSDSTSTADLAQLSGLLTYTLVLGAAAFVYFHWRTVGSPLEARLSGWLTVGLVAGGLHGIVQAVPLGDATSGPNLDRWPMVSQLALLIVLTVVAHLAEVVDVPREPALMGLVGALTLVAAYVLLAEFRPLTLPLVISALLNTLVMLASLLLALTILHRTTVSIWVRRRLALAAVSLTGAQCAFNLGGDHRTTAIAALATNMIGATAVCSMAHRLVRQSFTTHQTELGQLREALLEARAGNQDDRELLHELGATIAGIATANRVLQGPVTLHRRRRLEQMRDAEVARLERLLSRRAPQPSTTIHVDPVVERLVLSHQARGLDVQWTPSGLSATGDPDELAEVINVLLENARRHGGGGQVRLEAQNVGDHVEIVCSDDGPGVAPEVRDQVFSYGVRRSGSPGQGLGLGIAHRLMSERGGSLELTSSPTPGATFVARLPRKVLAYAARDHATQ